MPYTLYTAVYVQIRTYSYMYRDGWTPSARMNSSPVSRRRAEIYVCNNVNRSLVWVINRAMWTVTLDASKTCWLTDLLEARRSVYIQTKLLYSYSYPCLYPYACLYSFAYQFALIWVALLRHIFIHQLHIKRTWAVRLISVQTDMQTDIDMEMNMDMDKRDKSVYIINKSFKNPK
jgi:hypothetical protein